ncbi:substrate-binding domain-containing protein [Pseudomonas sp. B21-048]|nr:substrate-binding domain-containing protein [Pseudomonas sp. B21-048]UVK96704.1 substrate-binding domain-containing protein [Pseudomonas sp. B21-048]
MNLKELAHKLGLSQTTVSRALNGYTDVSEKTRERITAAAAAAGYRPNPVARRLATGRADAIGIVYPLMVHDLGDPYFVQVVAGMTETLGKSDMDLMLASASGSDEIRTYQRMIEGRRIDGMVVARTHLHDARLSYLAKKGVPFVAYGRSILPDPYAWLDFDTAAGLRMAVERLVSLKHQRIALLSGPRELYFVSQAREGYVKAMADAKLPVEAQYMVESTLDRTGGYEAMSRLLLCDPRPTAVIVDNPPCGAGAMRALVEAGVELGSEMSVIVHDGLPPDALMGYEITALQSAEPLAVGKKIIELMLALLDGESPENLQVLWQPTLKIGNSDGLCPG